MVNIFKKSTTKVDVEPKESDYFHKGENIYKQEQRK